MNIGALGASLAWSRPGDGDIVITTATGKNIYWGNKGPSANTDGGYLDRDDRLGTGPENIYWQTNGTAPPLGTYYACFQPYSFNPAPSVDNPLQAIITVRRPMNPTMTFTRTFTAPFQAPNRCSPTQPSYMGTFTNP